MDDEITHNLDRLEFLTRELVKRFQRLNEENVQLHDLVSAMESDNKKASRLISDHERMMRDRERLKNKIGELLEKFDRLRI